MSLTTLEVPGGPELTREVAELRSRVAMLETLVADLAARLAEAAAPARPQPKDWRAAVAAMQSEPGLAEVFDAALEVRERDREAARS